MFRFGLLLFHWSLLGIASNIPVCGNGGGTLIIPGPQCTDTISQNDSEKILNFEFIQGHCENITSSNGVNIVASFKEIDANIFENLPKTKSLTIENVNFTSISLITHNLMSLKFTNNNLIMVDIEIMEKLLHLNITGNKIQEFTVKSNEISTDLSLITLDLSHNHISKIDSLVEMLTLMYVDLSHNMLKHFPSVFRKFPNLIDLNLSYNKLRYCKQHFQSLEYLKFLDISGNEINSIDYRGLLERLPSLMVLGIQNNPIGCDQLKEMFDYFAKDGKELIKTQKCNLKTSYQGFCCEYFAKNRYLVGNVDTNELPRLLHLIMEEFRGYSQGMMNDFEIINIIIGKMVNTIETRMKNLLRLTKIIVLLILCVLVLSLIEIILIFKKQLNKSKSEQNATPPQEC